MQNNTPSAGSGNPTGGQPSPVEHPFDQELIEALRRDHEAHVAAQAVKSQPSLNARPEVPPTSERNLQASSSEGTGPAPSAEGGGGAKRPSSVMAPPGDPEDLPEFMKELENSKRGAETERKVRAVEAYIRPALKAGYPIGRIYAGLLERKRIDKVGRTQFEKVCRKLYPELFSPRAA